jgi:hypothetical protein
VFWCTDSFHLREYRLYGMHAVTHHSIYAMDSKNYNSCAMKFNLGVHNKGAKVN